MVITIAHGAHLILYYSYCLIHLSRLDEKRLCTWQSYREPENKNSRCTPTGTGAKRMLFLAISWRAREKQNYTCLSVASFQLSSCCLDVSCETNFAHAPIFFFVLLVRIATYNKEKTKENKRLSTSSSFSSVLSKGEKDLSLPSSLAKGQKGVKDSIVIEKRGKEKGAYSLAFSPISPVW